MRWFDSAVREWLGHTLRVRLAGAAIATAGLAFMGFGTLGSSVVQTAGTHVAAFPDPGCTAAGTLACQNEGNEGTGTTGTDCGNISGRNPSLDYFVFVDPHGDFTGNTQAWFDFTPPGSPVAGTIDPSNHKFFYVSVDPSSHPNSVETEASGDVTDTDLTLNWTGSCEHTTSTTT